MNQATFSCIYCHGLLNAAFGPRCSKCGSFHHKDCWAAAGGCANSNCAAHKSEEVAANPGPRMKRLLNEFADLTAKFNDHESISVNVVGAHPPQKYRVLYRIATTRLDDSNQPVPIQATIIDFTLPEAYPLEVPVAVAVERINHPAFGASVMFASGWNASSNVASLIEEVAQMLRDGQTSNSQAGA